MSANSFIVVFKESATPDEIEKYKSEVQGSGGEVTHSYGEVLKGFAAKIPEEHLIKMQSSLTDTGNPIDYIEADGIVSTQ